MPMIEHQLPAGFFFGAVIAYIAWRKEALSRSGAWAACILGGVIFGVGGFAWAALLLTFFVSSTLMSRLFAGRKRGLSEKFSKGTQRDWAQVLANGGVGVVLVITQGRLGEASWLWLAYAGALATVNGDTWATEIGVLSAKSPRLVTTGKTVPRGTSGGVSLLGMAATLAGAALVGLLAGLLAVKVGWLRGLVIGSAAGVFGASFDSFLGASVQAIYTCPICNKETEHHPLHSCGSATTQIRGWAWLNNDLVNLISAVIGAIAAAGLWLWVS